MMQIDSANKALNQIFTGVAKSPIMVYFAMFLVFYAPHMAPALPTELNWIFESVIARIIIMTAVAWKMTGNPIMSILIAIIFIVSINLLNHKSPFEKFDGPETMIYPGCQNVTKQILIDALGSEDKVQEAMRLSHVPLSVKLNDYYAPLIATYLLGRYNIQTPCSPPDDTYTGKWKPIIQTTTTTSSK